MRNKYTQGYVNFCRYYQTNKKFFVTVKPKNACKLEFEDNLWLPFIDQTQSGILVCAIITFHIYNIRATKCKHGIGPNDIILFQFFLEILSTSIIELVNIYESSYKEEIVIFITSKDLNTKKSVM